jgi:hypothetical protein
MPSSLPLLPAKKPSRGKRQFQTVQFPGQIRNVVVVVGVGIDQTVDCHQGSIVFEQLFLIDYRLVRVESMVHVGRIF